jgi:hypothetical protein
VRSFKRQRIPGIACMTCGARSIARTSEQVTPTVREVRYVCEDPGCEESFLAQVAVVRVIRPSLKKLRPAGAPAEIASDASVRRLAPAKRSDPEPDPHHGDLLAPLMTSTA